MSGRSGSVLVLNRGPLALRPYHDWLADHPGDLVLLASAEDLARCGDDLAQLGARYAHVEAVTDYDAAGHLEARALQLHGTYRFEHVVACQELDLQRAGALRALMGAGGQDFASASSYRDKALMKRCVQAAGLAVAAHAEVETASEVLAFVRDHGYPIVVKPCAGLSSLGLEILRDEVALRGWLTGRFDWYAGSGSRMLVEAFVPGVMHHVDGIVVDGQVVLAWPSQYLYDLAGFDNGTTAARLDVTLDVDDPLAAQLLAFTGRVIDALPSPGTSTFHAEIFRTPDGELVLCEIASRNAGALIKSLLHAMFGLDLPAVWVRASLGLPVPDLENAPAVPMQMAGQVLLLKRPGVIRTVPEAPPFPWITRYETYVRPGERSTGATSSGDFLAAMIVCAPDRATCEQRMHEVADWFEGELEIDPPDKEIR